MAMPPKPPGGRDERVDLPWREIFAAPAGGIWDFPWRYSVRHRTCPEEKLSRKQGISYAVMPSA
jgi:hypothetical protein